MTRVIDGLILNKDEGFSQGKAKQGMIDIRKGGMFGFAPNLSEWVSNKAYIARPVIPILLEAPQFFQQMANPELWVGTLKALVELHPQTIEGLNGSLEVEWDEHPIGGAGEMQQEAIDVKRVRTEPTFTFIEKDGRPIQTFLDWWIRYGIMDPNTKTSMLGTLPVDKIPKDYLSSWYTMTMAFIEPDITHSRVIKSWIVANMMPKTNGEVLGKRDLTTPGEILKLNIPFSGIAQFNEGTNAVCQDILDGINIRGANPAMQTAFFLRSDLAADRTDADVNAAKEASYSIDAEQVGKNTVAGTVGA